ncbi:diguanylate cyclase [Roseateles sp.]|jgi:diguanylate cyclase (GGDEF)-like protein|uniref:diguanylate cyclase n=1 Tax=Roseateles sp. TaxID=1971397 RepID=UPI0037CC97B9
MSKTVHSQVRTLPPLVGLWRGFACRIGLSLAALLVLMSLGACQPASAPLPPAASKAETLWTDFERIERAARARPAEQARELQQLYSRTLPGSAERLEALSLRGAMAARLRDRAMLDPILSELRNWPVLDGRPEAEVVATLTLARFQQDQGQLRDAKKTLLSLTDESIAQLTDRQRYRAAGLRSVVLADGGEFDAALLSGQEAMRLADQLGQSWRQALALSDMAWVYLRAEQGERARELANRALERARQDPDPETLNAALTILGNVYADHADTRITEKAYAEALEQARAAGGQGMLALGLGNFADYYLRRGDFAQALKLAEQALPLAQRQQLLSAEVLALHNMGIAKIGLKRLAEGTRDVRMAIKLDLDQGAIAYAAEGWAELGKYLESAGDWAGAIDAHHNYRRLIDQVLRDETRKSVLEAQESFEAERRAKDIELLARDNSLKAEQIRAQDLQLRLWAAVAGCVVVSAVLLGLAYQRIRRTNEALKHSNEHLKLQSESDPLTGLSNRRHFQKAVQRLTPAGGLTATVYLMDIDLFKRINDMHGHAAGDSVLVEVARRLRAALREDDLVVRWGGEEFLIVVPERDAEAARLLAQRLLDIVGQEPVLHGDKKVAVSASIGFASFPLGPHGLALTWERAIDLVDTAMYVAKAHGRNRAYGVQGVGSSNEAELLQLMPRLEAAWQEGRAEVVTLHGPKPLQEAA